LTRGVRASPVAWARPATPLHSTPHHPTSSLRCSVLSPCGLQLLARQDARAGPPPRAWLAQQAATRPRPWPSGHRAAPRSPTSRPTAGATRTKSATCRHPRSGLLPLRLMQTSRFLPEAANPCGLPRHATPPRATRPMREVAIQAVSTRLRRCRAESRADRPADAMSRLAGRPAKPARPPARRPAKRAGRQAASQPPKRG
jgi:hypothetical protein